MKNWTKVLHLVNGLEPSATRTLVFGLANGLDEKMYEVHIGAVNRVDGASVRKLVRRGVQIADLAVGVHGNLGLIRTLVGYIRANKIEIVHTHILRPDLLGGLATRLSWGPLVFSTKHNMGYVRGQRGWLLRNLFYWPAMYLPDQVVTVTETLRTQVISRLKIDPDRVTTIHNGIAVNDYYMPGSRLACRESLGIAADDIVVSYIGRLVEGKGLDCLLQAAMQVLTGNERFVFLVVGMGSLRASLQSLADELGIGSQVIFTGYREDIPEILSATDLLVLPSLSEGLPLSLMEAMAAGKPVVATAVGGIGELIEPNVTGILVAPRSAAALVEAICRLLDNSRHREEMGTRAREYVSRAFSVQAMVSAYDALYQARLAGRRTRRT